MRSIGFAIVLCSLCACGGSSSSDSALCTEVVNAFDGLVQKGAPCGLQFTSPVDSATCASHLPNCSDADRAALSAFSGCMKGMAACTAATEQTWANQAQTCVGELQPVSAKCQGN